MIENNETVKIFKDGKGTCCEWHFEDGDNRGRIFKQGEGSFFAQEFSSLAEAKRFCQKQLTEDPASMFHMMVGDDIVETVMDQKYHRQKEKRSRLVYCLVSSTVFAVIAVLVAAAFVHLETFMGYALFVGAILLIYLLFLGIMGTGNIEAAMVMVIILFFAAVGGPTIKGILEPNQGVMRIEAR